MANQVQTLTLSATPDSGTCDLTIGDCLVAGVTPANLATPVQIVALLTGVSRIFTSGVSASISGLVDTLTFTGPVGNYDWPVIEADTTNLYIATSAPTLSELTAGVAQVQNVWTMSWISGDGSGTWSVNVDGMDYSCDSSSGVNTSIPNCSVGGGGGSQTLIFSDAAEHALSIDWDSLGDDSDPSPSVSEDQPYVDGVAEVQVISALSGSPNRGGYYVAGVFIAYDASASDIEGAINSVLGGGTVAVTGDVGGPFTITWQSVGPQSLLTIDGVTVGTAVTIAGAITTHGSVGGVHGSVIGSSNIQGARKSA